MITTKDNPYNPNTDYDAWLDWDHKHGYYTDEVVASIANARCDDEEWVMNEKWANAEKELIESKLDLYINVD